MASNSNPCGLSISTIAQLNSAVGQQTAAFRVAVEVCRNYSKTIAQSTYAGKAEAASIQKNTAERNKSTQALGKEVQANRSAQVEQTLADLNRTGALLGVSSEAGKMRYETESGKYVGESDLDKDRLIDGATRLDKLREEMKMRAYIANVKNPNAAAEAEKSQKMAALDQALQDGTLDQKAYDKESRSLSGKKEERSFMEQLNDKLVESARNGANKIQDVLGTKMYDFVADKFDKMGLSFLNNVAKMVTSAASAKLMETLLGSDFMKNENGGALGGWISKAGTFISGLFGGGISVGSNYVSGGTALSSLDGLFPSAKGNAFTNGMVSSPVAFPMGVMGEAGPEAIMPLHRGSDGSLGIRAAFPNVAGDTGQVGGGVSVNVYVQDGNVNTETESGEGGWKQFGQQIGEYVNQLVDRRMTQSYRQGGLAWQASNNRLAGA